MRQLGKGILIFIILLLLSGRAVDAETEYIIQPGDTLSSIALQFGTTVEEIAAANNIVNPNLIQVWDVLIIPVDEEVEPAGEIYIVQPGDYLAAIAALHGISLDDLLAANDIQNPDLIYPGMELVIPVDESLVDETLVDGETGYGLYITGVPVTAARFPLPAQPLGNCGAQDEPDAAPQIILCEDLDDLRTKLENDHPVPGLDNSEEIVYLLLAAEVGEQSADETPEYAYRLWYNPDLAATATGMTQAWLNFAIAPLDVNEQTPESMLALDNWFVLESTREEQMESETLDEQLSDIEFLMSLEGGAPLELEQVVVRRSDGQDVLLLFSQELEDSPAGRDYVRAWCSARVGRGRYWFCQRRR